MEGHEAKSLAARQRQVLVVIARYWQATGEYPSQRYLARRLSLHLSTVQDHLDALYRKGWLSTPTPAGLRCSHVR